MVDLTWFAMPMPGSMDVGAASMLLPPGLTHPVGAHMPPFGFGIVSLGDSAPALGGDVVAGDVAAALAPGFGGVPMAPGAVVGPAAVVPMVPIANGPHGMGPIHVVPTHGAAGVASVGTHTAVVHMGAGGPHVGLTDAQATAAPAPMAAPLAAALPATLSSARQQPQPQPQIKAALSGAQSQRMDGGNAQPVSQHSKAAMARAHTHYVRGEYAVTEVICQAIVDSAPNRADALLLLGAAAYQRGDFARCAKCNAEAIRIDPLLAEAYVNLANALSQLGAMDASVAYYLAALRIRPNFREAYASLGACLLRSGDVARAADCYEHAARLPPPSAALLCHLGDLRRQLDDHNAAVMCYESSLSVDNAFAPAWAALATAASERGDVSRAFALSTEALRIAPESPEVLAMYGNLLRTTGASAAAVEFLSRATNFRRTCAITRANLGGALYESGRLIEAATELRTAVALSPHCAEAHNNLGNVLRDLGKLAEAAGCYQLSIQLQVSTNASRAALVAAAAATAVPTAAAAAVAAAARAGVSPVVLEGTGAAGVLQNAAAAGVSQLPPLAPPVALLRALETPSAAARMAAAEAAAAAASASTMIATAESPIAPMLSFQAMGFEPGSPSSMRLATTYTNLAGVFKALGRAVESAVCYSHVANLRPNCPETQKDAASAQKDLGRLDEAIVFYRRALGVKPDMPDAYANLVHSLMCVCEWGHRTELFVWLDALLRAQMRHGQMPSVQPFHAMAYPLDSELVKDLSKAYGRHCLLQAHVALVTLATTSAAAAGNSAVMAATPPAPQASAGLYDTMLLSPYRLPHAPRRPLRSGEKLKVAYVSSDFANHPLSHLMGSVFQLHDRSEVEVTAYAISASDGTAWRRRIEGTVENFVDVSSLSPYAVARKISDSGAHICVNLNGYTKGGKNEIFVYRPCAVQMSYMGFPATMGADFIDYLVSDAIVSPWELHGQCYTESLALMPHCYFCNDHRQVHMDISPPLYPKDVDLAEPRARIGLPTNASVIYACSNQLYKYDPDTFACWTRILRRVPGSVLWLLRFPPNGEARILRYAAELGAPPNSIIFTDVAGKTEHVNRSQYADVFLDTPMVNAHTTGCDVLWSGVPIVTLPMRRMASRVCASLCASMGLYEACVAHDLADYEEKAVRLGLDRTYRAALRREILMGRWTQPLFDTRRWVRDFERLMYKAWEIYTTGDTDDERGIKSFAIPPMPIPDVTEDEYRAKWSCDALLQAAVQAGKQPLLNQ